MINHSIKNYITGEILHEGRFNSMRDCVEDAIRLNVRLDYADLSNTNLINAQMDEAHMRHACLKNANLMGANISEADIAQTDFTNATLQSACLCFSDLRDCVFEGALFGATDIAGSTIGKSIFSTFSGLGLNFTDAADLKKCVFKHADDKVFPFSRVPVTVSGLAYPIVILDSHIRVGQYGDEFSEFFDLLSELGRAPQLRIQGGAFYNFLFRHRDFIMNAIKNLRPDWNIPPEQICMAQSA